MLQAIGEHLGLQMVIPGNAGNDAGALLELSKSPALFPSLHLLWAPAVGNSMFRHVYALVFTVWLLKLQLLILRSSVSG